MTDLGRRRFMKMMMAGGAIIAGDIWIPGEKKIFLPPKKVYKGDLEVAYKTPPIAPQVVEEGSVSVHVDLGKSYGVKEGDLICVSGHHPNNKSTAYKVTKVVKLDEYWIVKFNKPGLKGIVT